jgi:hypothetical protein
MNKKKIQELLYVLGYLFQIQNFEKQIVYKEKDNGNIAEMKYEEDYQRITLYIYPTFFTQEPTEQRKTLLHELCHTITVKQAENFENYIDGKRTTTKCEINEIMEKETSQIENIIDNLLTGNCKQEIKAYKGYIK